LDSNAAEWSAVALDTNALIAAVEYGQSIAVLGGRIPIVSITTIKQFLRGAGSLKALRAWLTDTDGRVGLAGSEITVRFLQQQAAALGRVLHTEDARIAASAMREGVPVRTNDVRFSRFLRAIGYPVEDF